MQVVKELHYCTCHLGGSGGGASEELYKNILPHVKDGGIHLDKPTIPKHPRYLTQIN